jgi:hypothetical protein
MNVPYFLARYVDDPLRMEPKNIGVVAVINDRVHARFLGEIESEGGIDLRRLRGHVRHTGAYRQWIEYWRYIIASRPTANDALLELRATSKANYLVSEGATLTLPDEHETDSGEIVEYLFNLLVSSFPEAKNEELSLAQRCDEIIGEYRLRQNPHFSISPTVPCRLPDFQTENVQPSYAYVNGAEIYFQKVPLVGNRPEYSSKEVHNAAWIFERLRMGQNQRQARALVKMAIAADFPDLLKALNAVATSVIDVDNPEQVHREFSAFVAH